MGVAQKIKLGYPRSGHGYTSIFLPTPLLQTYLGPVMEHRSQPACLLQQGASRSPYSIRRPYRNDQHSYPRRCSWLLVLNQMKINLLILHRLHRALLIILRLVVLLSSKLKVQP